MAAKLCHSWHSRIGLLLDPYKIRIRFPCALRRSHSSISVELQMRSPARMLYSQIVASATRQRATARRKRSTSEQHASGKASDHHVYEVNLKQRWEDRVMEA